MLDALTIGTTDVCVHLDPNGDGSTQGAVAEGTLSVSKEPKCERSESKNEHVTQSETD